MRGDCLVKMHSIADGSVDLILCDLPYGTTECRWDSVIPFQPLWEHYWRVLKRTGAVVLFGSEPFSTQLRMSQIRRFKYDWIWEKTKVSGFMLAKRSPLRCYEVISVFSRTSLASNHGVAGTYNPQGVTLTNKHVDYSGFREQLGQRNARSYQQQATNYPKNLLKFANEANTVHPTQKPVPLLEYLIKTYTNEGETVLDNCMGSGSTGVACAYTKRCFIGIERKKKYFRIAQDRIECAKNGTLPRQETETEKQMKPLFGRTP